MENNSQRRKRSFLQVSFIIEPNSGPGPSTAASPGWMRIRVCSPRPRPILPSGQGRSGSARSKAFHRARPALTSDNASRGRAVTVPPFQNPPAPGVWWVYVCDVKKLDAGRASHKELAEIAVAKTAAVEQNIRTAQQLANSRGNVETVDYASGTAKPRSSAGDSVYVQGYYRKNGTYVSSYTRSAPSHHR